MAFAKAKRLALLNSNAKVRAQSRRTSIEKQAAWSFKDVPLSKIEFSSNFKQSYNSEAINNYYNA